MAADVLSVKVLNMQGSSVFLHFEVNAFCLMLVTKESAPGLLNSYSCTRPSKQAFDIKDERLFVTFQQRQHFASLDLDIKLQSTSVVIVNHSQQLLHHKLIFALKVPHTLLVLILCKLFQSSIDFHTLFQFSCSHYLISVLDIAQLTYPDESCLELAGNFLAIDCHDLHGGPDHAAEGVILFPWVVLICEAFRISQSNCIELFVDLVGGGIKNGFSFVEALSYVGEEVIKKMLLVSVVIDTMVFCDAWNFIEGIIALEENVFHL